MSTNPFKYLSILGKHFGRNKKTLEWKHWFQQKVCEILIFDLLHKFLIHRKLPYHLELLAEKNFLLKL